MDLRRAFDFTKAETRVAHYLLQGYSAGQIADILDHSVATIRTQICAILKKSKSDRVIAFVLLVAQCDGWQPQHIYSVSSTRVKPQHRRNHHADLPLFK